MPSASGRQEDATKPLRKIVRAASARRHRRRQLRTIAANATLPGPPRVEPTWPLPRAPRGPGDADITRAFGKFPELHYAYKFEGGVSLTTRYRTDAVTHPDRPLQRFRHFMPWLLRETGGTLKGKRVLDIACNSGFWSIQCALLGAAEVVGFDARPELVEQANLVKSIVGLDNVRFQQMDFWEMSPSRLGGVFDVVLNLGILYHLPKPLEALELTKAMAMEHIVLDTVICAERGALIRVGWEEPEDIRAAVSPGIVMYPTRRAIDLMLKHLGVPKFQFVPLRTRDMPEVYIDGGRASWLISLR